jgi:hypothetical protein
LREEVSSPSLPLSETSGSSIKFCFIKTNTKFALQLTVKASCGLFQTQHEAELHDIPADAHSREHITMEFQYFVSLSEEWVEDHFLASDGSTNYSRLTLQGCREQPVQDF